MKVRISAVSALLFCSGACALVYQVAWFRELRLVFGASTAASSAVLAIFMGGLGFGGAMLGKRADASPNPLAMYAKLEVAVACGAALTPFLVLIANYVYLGSGGTESLGLVGATLLRIVLSVVVLGPITFLMGGTLPAAARAIEREDDGARRGVAVLYGANTAGAVAGTILANFLLLEVLGTRATLWGAALLNVLVGLLAQSWSRRMRSSPPPAEAAAEVEAPSSVPSVPGWAPPGAAALAGLAFMLMELTWYRMLGPLLGGSSYTFGLILAVALVGIGIGGGIYAKTRIPSTLRGFAITCALEALFIAIPYAVGDDVAMAALALRPACRAGFGASVAIWSGIASFVILPAAIVSGIQFPLVIGLYGGKSKQVGRDVGAAYLANTLGSIVGALAGGFGLLPLLGAIGVWKLVVIALVIGSVVAVVFDRSNAGTPTPAARLVRGLALACVPVALLFARGPSAVWRHSGIGAGRAEILVGNGGPTELSEFRRRAERGVRWESDGVESTVALDQHSGYAFIVNGKSDGHALSDAPTQVMSGLIASLIHGEPKQALVIGLGTGSTAGWLGVVPSMERVDVVELEASILRVARDCAPVNQHVLDNPKVHITLGDAREYLRTTRSQFDIIFSEPSNPFRAGISSLYTLEYYQAARTRIREGGLFVQWIQAYEVDDWGIATALTTLRQVFADVEVWRTEPGDLLLVARQQHRPLDVARTGKLIETEPYASAARAVWRSEGVESMLSHFVARSTLADVIVAQHLGAVNTDDQNFLEFAFARQVGRRHMLADENIIALSRRLGLSRPDVVGTYDGTRIQDEIWLTERSSHTKPSPADPSAPPGTLGPVLEAFAVRDYPSALARFDALGRTHLKTAEGRLLAEAAARGGSGEGALARVELGPERERPYFRAVLAHRQGDDAAASDALLQLFVAARTDAWIPVADLEDALEVALEIARRDPTRAQRFADTLKEPFAVEDERDGRLAARALLAPLLPDPQSCVEIFEALEPPPWQKTLLTYRVGCYVKTNHPRALAAERELQEYLSVDVPPIGASLKGSSAPPPASSTGLPRYELFEKNGSGGNGAGKPGN